MNHVRKEDIIVGATFKENKKPTATEFKNGMIASFLPQEVIIVDRHIDRYGPEEVEMVLYKYKNTGAYEEKTVEGFIKNFKYNNKRTHCWHCHRIIDQNKKTTLDECIVCGGIKCPEDVHCLCTNPIYGDYYKPSKGRILN